MSVLSKPGQGFGLQIFWIPAGVYPALDAGRE
jgi:hypothetical protein